jgi:hypothetical protein
MQLLKVSAKTGYVWFRQGIWLFRRNPLAFLTIFFAYLFSMMVVSLVPVIGAVLPLLFIPGISVGFMAASRNAVLGKPIYPTVLLAGFRDGGTAVARQLLILGVTYVISIAVVFGVSALVDGGLLLRLMVLGSPMDDAALANSNLPGAVLVAMLAYTPVAMLFWFAPVLTAWHDIPPLKALFFSLVTCWRNRSAFLLYAVIWGALAVTVSFGLTALLHALGAGTLALTVLMPASIILTSMLYCSFYATYRGCYAMPDAAANADADPKPLP